MPLQRPGQMPTVWGELRYPRYNCAREATVRVATRLSPLRPCNVLWRLNTITAKLWRSDGRRLKFSGEIDLRWL